MWWWKTWSATCAVSPGAQRGHGPRHGGNRHLAHRRGAGDGIGLYPAAFLPGTTGQLYKQFAITIVISVAVSGFVALTLTPAMCGALLKHGTPPTRGFFAWFNRQVEGRHPWLRPCRGLCHQRMLIAFMILAVLVWAIIHLSEVLPTSFVPNEDQGYVMAAIIMPDGASLNRTEAVSDRVDRIFEKLPGVDTRTQVPDTACWTAGSRPTPGPFLSPSNPLRNDTPPSRRPRRKTPGPCSWGCTGMPKTFGTAW